MTFIKISLEGSHTGAEMKKQKWLTDGVTQNNRQRDLMTPSRKRHVYDSSECGWHLILVNLLLASLCIKHCCFMEQCFSYFLIFLLFLLSNLEVEIIILLALGSRGLYEQTVIYVSEPITRPLVKVSDHLFCFELIGFHFILGSSFFFLLFSSGFLAACPAQGSTQLSVLQMRFSVESKGWNSENKSQQKQVVLQFNDLDVWLCLVVSIWNEQQPTYTHNTRVHTLAQRIGLTN